MSARQHDALRSALGALAFLGVAHLRGEWRDSLAVWAHGREPPALALAPAGLIALAGGASALVALGWRWRIAGGVALAALAGLYALAPVTYHNNLYLLWLFLLLAVLTGGRWKSHGVFAWLVRWQVAFVYLAAAAVKLTHPFWQGSGAALRWLATERVPDTIHGVVNPLLRPWLARPGVSSLLDHATIVAELAIPALLLTPRWRRAGLALGVALHWAFQAWLHPQLFTFLMLWGYFAFVPADDRGWTVEAPRGLARRLAHADWLGRMTLRDGPALAVTSPEGLRREGLAAWQTLAALTPVTLLVVATPILVAPQVQTLAGAPRAAIEELALLALAVLTLAATWTQRCSPPRG